MLKPESLRTIDFLCGGGQLLSQGRRQWGELQETQVQRRTTGGVSGLFKWAFGLEQQPEKRGKDQQRSEHGKSWGETTRPPPPKLAALPKTSATIRAVSSRSVAKEILRCWFHDEPFLRLAPPSRTEKGG